jgi:hypothetical protein
MSDPGKLIPPPPVLRHHLAQNFRERRLLRALLRLSIRAVHERRQEGPDEPRHEADGRGVAR